MKSHFDKSDELPDERRVTTQGLAGLEQDARQQRLAMEANVPSDIKTRNPTEDVAADRVISGDSSSANQVNPDQMYLTSFGADSTGPPTLSCTRDGTLVDNGAAAPKPRLSPVEMRTPTATGGLLPAGTASTTMRTIFPRPLFSWSLRETKKHTSSINFKLAPSW